MTSLLEKRSRGYYRMQATRGATGGKADEASRERMRLMNLAESEGVEEEEDRPIVAFAHEATSYKSQVTSYKLQVTSYKLQVTSYKLQPRLCKGGHAVQRAACSLQLAAWSSELGAWSLQSVACSS